MCVYVRVRREKESNGEQDCSQDVQRWGGGGGGGGGCLSIQEERGAGGLGACSPRKLF